MLDHLPELVDSKGFELVDILQYNPEKKTAVLIVTSKLGTYGLMKLALDPSSTSFAGFEKELEFYKSHLSIYTPQMLSSDHDYFVIEYLEGETLDKVNYVSSNNETEVLMKLEGVLGSIFPGSAQIKSKSVEKPEANYSFIKYGAKLFKSGLWGTKSSFASKIFRIIVWELLKRLIKRTNNFKLVNSLCPVNETHNDFHLKNAMLLPSGELKVLDFESVGPGFIEIDKAYMLAMLSLRVSEDSLNRFLKSVTFSESEIYMIRIYIMLVRTNPRFYPENYNEKKMGNLVKLVRYLWENI